ncbi:hypothetical protein BSFA1_76640 (plasmid) [Burkholderia sp. SFA1]|nr:hypothetical protein BSFA1_76420 [Burkholderia sp. SFA1]BBQ02536.1 hypothetical protein BSFA1_76640 [Burkholderia sp. SFA1]
MAFSAVVSSALSYLGLIVRGEFPGIVDMQPRGHDAFISEYALARVFPNDNEQLLDHLITGWQFKSATRRSPQSGRIDRCRRLLASLSAGSGYTNRQ